MSALLCGVLAVSCKTNTASPQPSASSPPVASVTDDNKPAARDRDSRVSAFLERQRDAWRDYNVPYVDGKVLHDLVVRDRHTSILEIGTSTGHSTIWLAWAASKIGGHVVTIEIDEARHKQAIDNVRAAGLSDYVDFRLADAHELVKQLPGPFDFVFSDADKGWYVQYFEDLDSKITAGGCIAAHNALNGFPGVDRYIAHVRKRADYKTRIDRTSASGFAISCKSE